MIFVKNTKMTNEQKQTRLTELQEQAAKSSNPPNGLLLTIEKLKQELGLSDICDLDDGCINCGS